MASLSNVQSSDWPILKLNCQIKYFWPIRFVYFARLLKVSLFRPIKFKDLPDFCWTFEAGSQSFSFSPLQFQINPPKRAAPPHWNFNQNFEFDKFSKFFVLHSILTSLVTGKFKLNLFLKCYVFLNQTFSCVTHIYDCAEKPFRNRGRNLSR